MTKEELKQEAEEKYFNHKMMEFQGFYNRHYYYLGYLDSAEPREKRIAELEKEIAELEEKISVLLSCKNCSENKGGWICVKEYENKCLAQKIEFIKELKEEKCELLGIIQGKDKVIQELKKELNSMLVSKNQQLVKAKELIEELSSSLSVVGECEEEECELLDRAEQFLRENE